jgi:hypothetical protein
LGIHEISSHSTFIHIDPKMFHYNNIYNNITIFLYNNVWYCYYIIFVIIN